MRRAPRPILSRLHRTGARARRGCLLVRRSRDSLRPGSGGHRRRRPAPGPRLPGRSRRRRPVDRRAVTPTPPSSTRPASSSRTTVARRPTPTSPPTAAAVHRRRRRPHVAGRAQLRALRRRTAGSPPDADADPRVGLRRRGRGGSSSADATAVAAERRDNTRRRSASTSSSSEPPMHGDHAVAVVVPTDDGERFPTRARAPSSPRRRAPTSEVHVYRGGEAASWRRRTDRPRHAAVRYEVSVRGSG